MNWRSYHIRFTPMQARIMDCLALASGALLLTDALISDVYRGAFEPENPRAVIRIQIHRLRRKLAGTPFLIASKKGPGGGYQLILDGSALDVR